MAEHIMTFAKIKNDNYTQPKDKFKWNLKDNRKDKYRILRRRFILTNKFAPFKHPGKLPEDD